MAEPTELRKDDNLLRRMWREFQDESKAKLLSVSGLIVGFLGATIGILALDDAKEAKIRVEFQDEKIRRLSEQVDYWTAVGVALRAEMKVRGYEVPELPEPQKEDE